MCSQADRLHILRWNFTILRNNASLPLFKMAKTNSKFNIFVSQQLKSARTTHSIYVRRSETNIAAKLQSRSVIRGIDVKNMFYVFFYKSLKNIFLCFFIFKCFLCFFDVVFLFLLKHKRTKLQI